MTIMIADAYEPVEINVKMLASVDYFHIKWELCSHHGNLYIRQHRETWHVDIRDDFGKLENHAKIPRKDVQREIVNMAIHRGWGSYTDKVYSVDLAQFDPWDLGYCVQMAAFGEHIVG